jgi:biotin carboxylase
MTAASRPLLVVPYARGAARPLGIAAAARAHADVLFLADLTDEPTRAELAAGAKAVRTLDTSGLTADEVVSQAAALRPAGVTTFSETLLPLTARIVEACGVPGHDVGTAARLRDKWLQRQALADAGVDGTACVAVAGAEDLEAALARTGTPAVLKPRRGMGSVNTQVVHSAEACAAAYRTVTADGDQGGYVLEEYLRGDPAAAGPEWGDYVSVESLVVDGEIHTVGLTGRFPLAPSLRENGTFAPSTLSATQAAEAVRVEHAALRALGVRHGPTHTELKLTPDGPRVIEVNGRMGGYVADLHLRARGVRYVEAAVLAALGLDPAAALRPDPRRAERRAVAFQFCLVPPAGVAAASALDDLAGLEALHEVPGIDYVEVSAPRSRRTDALGGLDRLLGSVYGLTADHAALHRTVTQLRARLREVWPHPAG